MGTHRVWLRLGLAEGEPESFRAAFPAVAFVEGPELSDSELDQIDVLFAADPVPDELVAKMGALKWLHTTSGGGGRFLSPLIVERSVQVTTSTGIHGRSFAEFAIACMFGLAKSLPIVIDAQRQAQWDRNLVAMDRVEGRTVGIVGLGTIGSAVARQLKALGLRVIATKRHVGETPPYVDELGPPEHLGKLLREAEVLFLCLPSNAVEGLIGEAELRSMKPGSYFINLTGSRSTIDEAALARVLRDGHLAGAALNVLASRPLEPESELWHLPNMIISPGLAGDDPDKWKMQRAIFVDNLGRFVRGEELRNVVDTTQGY